MKPHNPAFKSISEIEFFFSPHVGWSGGDRSGAHIDNYYVCFLFKLDSVIILDALKRINDTPNTKLILAGCTMLIALVSCSVAIARYI